MRQVDFTLALMFMLACAVEPPGARPTVEVLRVCAEVSVKYAESGCLSPEPEFPCCDGAADFLDNVGRLCASANRDSGICNAAVDAWTRCLYDVTSAACAVDEDPCKAQLSAAFEARCWDGVAR